MLRFSLSSPVETPVLVQPQANPPEGILPSGPAQYDRQTVQTTAGHSDGMVTAPGCLCSDLPQVAPPRDRHVCNQVQ